MLDRFKAVVDNRHEYARDWKERTGGKVVGFFCTYVPEEILYAANILPVRVLGGLEPQDQAESHIGGMYCPFCRDVLAQGLKGKYDYLDGIVMAKSCQHIHQAFQSWQMHIPLEYSYFMGMTALPQRPSAKKYFMAEIKDFKNSLETWLGRPITDEYLDEAIGVYNNNRRLLHQLYDTRKVKPPLVSGTEALSISLSSMLMDKVEHSKLLSEALQELPLRQDKPPAATRIMVIGSETSDLGLFQLLEKSGTNIVVEDLCTGSRYFWNEVVPETDRLSAIAQRYLDRPACPLKDVMARTRLTHILNLAKEFNVQGALLLQQKFCDPHEFDIPVISKFLREHDIPTYFMEIDVTFHSGAVRTRTEAFVEMLELEVA